MAYFHRQFGYSVSGLEYAEVAAAATKRNMALLGIEAPVIVQDFLSFDYAGQFDVVFSAGFIEHFRDVTPVVQRICRLARGYVVTIVPNCSGINGFISRTIRPVVYAEHNPINVPELESMHAKCGLQTLFCDYVGGVRFIMPAAGNNFFKTHRCLARAANTPVRAFNGLSEAASRLLHCTLRSAFLSDSLMYVGTHGGRQS